MKARTVFLGVTFVLAGCGQPASQGAAPSASASVSAAPVKSSLERKATPTALRAQDEEACLAGKAESCRRMADRYRGYGHVAGCGITRDVPDVAYGRMVEPMQVRIKRLVEDENEDEKSFLVWIGKACDLGDSEACLIEGAIREVRQPVHPDEAEWAATRSSVRSSAMIGFHALWNSDKHQDFLDKRQKCLADSNPTCSELGNLLIARTQKEPRPELNADLMAGLKAIGERTLDFASLKMMLDKNGIGVEATLPLDVHARKVLVDACLEGSCVCGDAAASLLPDDLRVVELARWGCENGEASGCYVLGRLHEEGRGVEKDEVFAHSLYELACPPTQPSSTEYHMGDYSPAACSRLAELAEGGVVPPKDRESALFYARYACRRPGYEKDHNYCVKFAKYWANGTLTSSCSSYNAEWCRDSLQRAEELFNGPKAPPIEGRECERASVRAACDALLPDMNALKNPTNNKKK